MSLRLKVTVVMAVALLLMVGLDVAALLPVWDSFGRLERAQAQRDNERIEQAITVELQHLGQNALDWSNWNDAFDFAAGKKPSFVADNLTLDSLKNLDTQLLYVYDRSAGILWGGIYHLDTGKPFAIPQFAPGALRPDDALLNKDGAKVTTTGIMTTGAGLMLVASSPIVRTDRATPADGTILFGRLLNAKLIDRMRKQARVDFGIRPATAAEIAAIAAESGFSSRAAGHDVIVGSTILKDVYGRPAFILRTMTPRNVSRIGWQAISASLASLVLAGLANLLVIWILLRRLVLGPVTRITGHVLTIGRTGALDGRVPALGEDELGLLAREFNGMLDRLAAARTQLIEHSHRTGVEEVAAGVLHNLRNGLTPLLGQLEQLSEAVRRMPGGELRRAAGEVGDPSTDPERRARLLAYVAATGDAFVAFRQETLDELGRATALSRKLGDILRHQDKFIYSTSRLGPLALREVLDDALGLLPQGLADQVTIEIDPAVDRLPAVLGERIALMQVFHNVLLNAAEAIRAAGREHGRVTVTGALHGDLPAMVDLRITDDGLGLDDGDLARIFERGYTTKPRKAGGLGLHWCANAVINMQGRLTAESAGRGRGTTLRLELPVADAGEAAA